MDKYLSYWYLNTSNTLDNKHYLEFEWNNIIYMLLSQLKAYYISQSSEGHLLSIGLSV